jgi:hypothetical protein
MSSESLKSLIVTDPDIVDEGIDISGLRTQTDTNPRLLASIADFPGISYDPTSFDYLSDLNELFAYGLPTTETDQAQIPGAIDTLVDTGGGGQATLPGFEDTTPEPINTPEDQRLIDEGIGLQIAPGQPVFAPGEMPVTQEEIDAFNAPATLDSTSTADEIMQDLLNQQAMLNPTGGNIMDEVALTGGIPDTNIISPSGDIFAEGDPLAEEKIDVVTQEDVDNPTNLLQKLGIPEDFDIKKALIDTGINLIAGVPITLIAKGLEAVLPDDNIAPSTNVARSTGLLQGDNTITQDIYGINTQTSFDPVKSTKNYNDYNVEQVTKLENVLDDLKTNKYIDDEQTYLDNTKRLRQELEDRKEYLDAINKDPLYGGDIQDTGDASIAEQIAEQNRITGDLPGGGNIYDEFAPSDDKDDSPASSTPSVNEADVEAGLATESISDFVDDFEVSGEAAPITGVSGADSFFDAVDTATGGGGDRDDSPAASAPSVNEADVEAGLATESISDYEDQSYSGGDGGDDGGGGGGCCFIMLEARYGNGTMDKVVRRYRDENMTPRNRRGYHKVAEVLVPLMRKSKIFKWIVTKTFADPLVSYGKWYYGENKHGWIFAPVKSAWLKLFDVVGTDTVFIRENGEEV